jgi:acetyl esterase/lipase
MIKALTLVAFVLLFGGLLYQFAALKVFNLMVPKDAGSTLVGTMQHYGAGADQTLHVFKPNLAAEAWPTLVFVHGGSWQEGDTDGCDCLLTRSQGHGLQKHHEGGGC